MEKIGALILGSCSLLSLTGCGGESKAVAEACDGARIAGACFVASDGKRCNDDYGPIGQLFTNGSYRVAGRDVDAEGNCVVTLDVSGTINGNSYSKTVRVWAFKPR